jgi:putative flippase GtrA
MLLHLALVWLLVGITHWQPLQANVIGFLGAVNISYLGHSLLTFDRVPLSLGSFIKFFSVACLSFIINQVAYSYGLSWFGNALYLPVLAAVLILVAVCTFVFSKFWVFTKA